MSKSILPHSAETRSEIDRYLSEVGGKVEENRLALKLDPDFNLIYKTATAVDAVIAKLSSKLVPHVSVLRGAMRRVPVLVAVGQFAAAHLELRQFIESVFRVVYFSQHPIEWEKFCDTLGQGIAMEKTEPIEFNARREPSFYRNYAKERFSAEPSGMVVACIGDLNVKYDAISGFIHGGNAVSNRILRPEFDAVAGELIRNLSRDFRAIGSAGCIILCAFNVKSFDKFPPANRAWFDWLIGVDKNKKIRSGSFGLTDAF